MVSSLDAAKYILKKIGPITAMKLQKLVYYCQAWSLVWDEAPLFDEKIEAWANGPVVRKLYSAHRQQFLVDKLRGGNASKLSPVQVETIDAVLDYYGDESSQYLSDLTHVEDPWRNAREGLPVGRRSNIEISHASMAEYYGSLPPDSQ